MKKFYLFITLGIVIISVIFVITTFFQPNKLGTSPKQALQTDNAYMQKHQIMLGGKTVYVDIADTPDKQAKGLGGTEFLHDDEGMLFVFQNKMVPTFWMKNMLIPIDIVWITDGKVVGIEKNVQPEPGTKDVGLAKYAPKVPVETVLELPAGYCDKHSVGEGTEANLNL